MFINTLISLYNTMNIYKYYIYNTNVISSLTSMLINEHYEYSNINTMNYKH